MSANRQARRWRCGGLWLPLGLVDPRSDRGSDGRREPRSGRRSANEDLAARRSLLFCRSVIGPLPYRAASRKSGPPRRNYVPTRLRPLRDLAEAGGDDEVKATCSFPTTGRRGAKVVTTMCLKGFLSASNPGKAMLLKAENARLRDGCFPRHFPRSPCIVFRGSVLYAFP
jgi:hypothetical protein